MVTSHSKLIDSVAQLDKGQRIKKAERSEPSIEVSEYHLISGISKNNAVRPEDLLKSLGQKGHQREIIKKLKYVRQKCKVLPKPLEKPAAERIKRKIGYNEIQKELNKWNDVISKNRTSLHLSFPLRSQNDSKKVKESPALVYLKRCPRFKPPLLKKLEEVDPSIRFTPVEEKEDYKCKDMTRQRQETRQKTQDTINKTKYKIATKDKTKRNTRRGALQTQLSNVASEGEDALINRKEKTNITHEAFESDNAEEFREKEEENKNSQSKDMNSSLPGWGSWIGPEKGKKKNHRKKQIPILNIPKEAPRKEENKGKLIIFEDSNEQLKKHLVSELPYPFTKIADFEASIRAPVSRTFVTEKAHLRLIRPAMKTKIGQVIEPMDEDMLDEEKKQPTLKKSQKRRIHEENRKRSTAKNNKKRRK